MASDVSGHDLGGDECGVELSQSVLSGYNLVHVRSYDLSTTREESLYDLNRTPVTQTSGNRGAGVRDKRPV